MERFELSVAIERLERFEPTVVGRKRSQIGKLNFVAKVKSELGLKASRREVIDEGGTYALREESEAYGSKLTGKNEALSSKNSRFWKENSNRTVT